MRVQISLPDKVWEQLCDVAHSERRLPKAQIEYMVIRSISGADSATAEVAPAGSR